MKIIFYLLTHSPPFVSKLSSSLKVFHFHEGAEKVPHYWFGGRGEIGQRQWAISEKPNRGTY